MTMSTSIICIHYATLSPYHEHERQSQLQNEEMSSEVPHGRASDSFQVSLSKHQATAKVMLLTASTTDTVPVQ